MCRIRDQAHFAVESAPGPRRLANFRVHFTRPLVRQTGHHLGQHSAASVVSAFGGTEPYCGRTSTELGTSDSTTSPPPAHAAFHSPRCQSSDAHPLAPVS